MQVKDVMHKNLITIGEDTSIREITRLMVEHRISSLPVLDREKRFIGIVPEDHLIARLKGPRVGGCAGEDNKVRDSYQSFISEQKRLHGKVARDILEKQVKTLTESTDLIDAIDLMLEKGYSRFPVLRGEKLVGVLSRADVIRALNEKELSRDKFIEEEPDDDEIVKRIAAAFKEQLGMQLVNTRLACVKGAVTLSGEVGSQDDYIACGEIAKSIPGVRSVENNLVLDALLK